MRKEKLKDMRAHPLAFVDLETTGIIPAENEIIEIAYVIVSQKTLKVQKERVFQVKPKHIETADPLSLKIIDYNNRDWSKAISQKQAMKNFARDAKGAILVGQNVSMDWAFLRKAFSEEKIEDPLQYHRLDVMSMAFLVLKSEKALHRYSLKELTEFFHIKVGKEHTALDDAKATYEVYKKLIKYKKK